MIRFCCALLVLTLALPFPALSANAGASPEEAARGLLTRLLPDHQNHFVFETIPKQDGLDVFEIESSGGRIVLRGSTGVAMSSALNHYLKNYCQASVSLSGNQLDLPDPLPTVEEVVRIVTPFKYRYCFNYCCFSYSMAWWDWAQWERAIDWMALQGINMPLAVTGQEATWQAVLRKMGLSDSEILEFMVGAAYLPFGWMGCMDGWGGPLTQDWIDRHQDLQKKILARERELGMTPVLQGFTGHVPTSLRDKFPDASFQQLPSWAGFPGTFFVDPQDPLFEKIGRAFIEEQTKQYGTDHLYAADTFIEMSPPSNYPEFLDSMAKAVYGAMEAGDPKAVWVMQGWLFVNNPDFWKPPQSEALLTAITDDRMIVLDLYCERRPAWRVTESFYGKPWVWCIIQSFGNQVSLHGGLPQIVENLNAAFDSPDRGKLSGMGCIMEGLGYNPVVYDLMNDLFWQPMKIDLDSWIRDYAERRYGQSLPKAVNAWKILLSTAYQEPGQIGSDICRRPGPLKKDRPHPTGHSYSAEELAQAWKLLLECADELAEVDTYQYDIVHIGRQVLADLFAHRRLDLDAAYQDKDGKRLTEAANRLLEVMRDVDELLGTRKEFLLGCWLEDARRWGANDSERRLYEWNARNQITLWGPADSTLHDYAAKQWSGLIYDFYIPRWEKFLDALKLSIESRKPIDAEEIDLEFQEWEDAWTHRTRDFPTKPMGDPVKVALAIWEKYWEEVLGQ